MSWRHRIAGAMLIVLAGLPIGAMFCAFRCDSSARTIAEHHADGRTCDDGAPQYGPQIAAELSHDCTSHGLTQQAATTAAERTDIITKPAVRVIATIYVVVPSLEGARSTVFSASPPGIAPPTIPVVLRI